MFRVDDSSSSGSLLTIILCTVTVTHRALDSYARVSIVKQGRRVVAFEAQAWQDDPAKPIASAFGHFMLRKAPVADED
jgi:acyl-coenzyme A thioesterase PaaI-like protein